MDGHRQPTVVIVGAGMSGICMGIKLKQAGIESFTIYEKGSSVGGTWRDNTYPGLSCDVPSRFYQYSFRSNPDWTHLFSPGREIWEYFDRAADEYDLGPHITFNTEVLGADFANGRWRIRTSDGKETVADFLISATGVLHHPRYPDIEGLDTFAGAAFHSARWDHDAELAGKRVGVVGTGSTAVQLTSDIARKVERLLVFQRSAQWVFPVPNWRYSRHTRATYRRIPALSRIGYLGYKKLLDVTIFRAVIEPGWQRWLMSSICRLNLRTVRDPELRRALTPDYQPMCKRLVMAPHFYREVQRANVDIVTEGIQRVEPRGIVTRDGRLHELDVLVLATGFDSHAYVRPMELAGVAGITLEEAWRHGPRAYRTVALPGFPNFFMLMGPHSPIGNYSLVAIAETQVRFVMKWISRWCAGEVATLVPTEEATERFNLQMRAAMPSTVWVTGCRSWYLGKDGVPELWPWTPAKHEAMLREPDPAEFHLEPVPDSATPDPAESSPAS
ncbi:MAG: flavin-containing monooxygenase [Haloechinothrix sp.]